MQLNVGQVLWTLLSAFYERVFVNYQADINEAFTLNAEFFARVSFSRNFEYAKFRENKNRAVRKGEITQSAVYNAFVTCIKYESFRKSENQQT